VSVDVDMSLHEGDWLCQDIIARAEEVYVED